MKLKLTTYFRDGTSGITEIENPPGANPDSIVVIAVGLLEAEKTGKRVLKIGRTMIDPFSKPSNPVIIEDNLITREHALETLKMAISPMRKEFEILFS